MRIHSESDSATDGAGGHPDVLRVAAAQFAPGADKQRNLERINDLVGAAVDAGARVVVLPEYSAYFEPKLGTGMLDAAERLDGAFVGALARIAAGFGVYLVAGMVEVADVPGKVHNTIVAVSDAGRVVSSYRKVHLYDAFGGRESDWMAAGPIVEAAVFDVAGVRFGLQTCYDIRFPEVSRRLVDAGADVLVVPAEWVRGSVKEHHWRTLLTARAIENTAYVVAADHLPPVGIGCSLIVDPLGDVRVELGDEEGVAVADIRPDLIIDVRAVNPALTLRRFGVVPRESA